MKNETRCVVFGPNEAETFAGKRIKANSLPLWMGEDVIFYLIGTAPLQLLSSATLS